MEEYKVGDIVTFRAPVMGTIEKIEKHYGRTVITVKPSPITCQVLTDHIIYKHE